MRTAVAAQRDLAVLKGTSVYIAGPMTGIEEFNFPAFQTAAGELYAMGVGHVKHTGHGTPPSPTEAKPWETYLRDALRYMLSCNAVVVLPGWRESRGARLEVYVALELGMPVVEYPDASHVTDAEYGTQTAEYIERRYGGVEPRTGHHIKPEGPSTVTIAGVEFDTTEDPEQ